MAKIIDGNKVSEEIRKNIKEEIDALEDKPGLAVILVGDDPASKVYVNIKKKRCNEVGIRSSLHALPKDTTEDKMLDLIDKLNKDDGVTGILVQLPLPAHIDQRKILDSVDVKKDVDGLHSQNLMMIMLDKERFIPCTPKGILNLFHFYGISLEGKNICVVGFSDVVGKPLATLCLNKGATVTVCHIKTKNLKYHTSKADILMTATGVPHLIKEDMIKKDAVVIDIGIAKIKDRIVGDVDFENAKDKAAFITPVPGGVGPMTVASLLENTLLALRYKNGEVTFYDS